MEKYFRIVTEKPDSAQKISEYLDRRGNSQKVRESGRYIDRVHGKRVCHRCRVLSSAIETARMQNEYWG